MMRPGEAFCGRCGASLDMPAAGISDRYETQSPALTQMNMTKSRTAGMTTVAILNLILAGYPMLLALLSLNDLPRRLPDIFAVLVLLWLANGVIGILAGVGVLKLSAWGKTMSLVFAGTNVLIFILFLMVEILRLSSQSELGLDWPLWLVHFIAYLIYCVTLRVLFQKSNWKHTFSASR